MGATRGNKFAIGNKGGGREPLYKTPDEMQERIENYFNTEKVPTVPGLAYHLGFCSRQSLIDYETKDEFFFPIKRAKLRIEAFNAEQLHRKEGSVTGVIFTLKNLGWTDQQSIDLTTDISQMSESQLIIIGNTIAKKHIENDKR